jgi:hypothetical protein
VLQQCYSNVTVALQYSYSSVTARTVDVDGSSLPIANRTVGGRGHSMTGCPAPIRRPNVTDMLPMCYRCVTDMLPICYRNVTDVFVE